MPRGTVADTSWLFKHIQSPLRKHVQQRRAGQRKSVLQQEHPVAVTVFLIHQALLLLRVNCGDIGEGQTYWRGVRGTLSNLHKPRHPTMCCVFF